MTHGRTTEPAPADGDGEPAKYLFHDGLAYHRHHQVTIPEGAVFAALLAAGWDLPHGSGLASRGHMGEPLGALVVWWQEEIPQVPFAPPSETEPP
jgi:hypothetical protein